MGIRRTKHAVYDLKYHLVWVPKYRKHVLGGEVSVYLKKVFKRISEEYGFEIDTMEVVEDHVHLFLEGAPQILSGTGSTDHEKHLGPRDVQEVSQAEKTTLGQRIVERWLLCS